MHPKNEKNRDSCVCKLLKGYQSCDTKNKSTRTKSTQRNSTRKTEPTGTEPETKTRYKERKKIQIDDRTKRQILRKQSLIETYKEIYEELKRHKEDPTKNVNETNDNETKFSDLPNDTQIENYDTKAIDKWIVKAREALGGSYLFTDPGITLRF